mmetsp:Transcript_27202/g.76403  ORF Transcript_27202/g.76403 Transcript_27202/m.76403 type:complete len:96 (-) Transcript_27202:844-1131(-)
MKPVDLALPASNNKNKGAEASTTEDSSAGRGRNSAEKELRAAAATLSLASHLRIGCACPRRPQIFVSLEVTRCSLCSPLLLDDYADQKSFPHSRN